MSAKNVHGTLDSPQVEPEATDPPRSAEADSVPAHMLEERTTTLIKAVISLSQRLDANNGATSSKITVINNKIDAVNERLGNKIDAVNEKLDNKIDAVNTRIDEGNRTLTASITALGEKLDNKIDKNNKELAHNIAAVTANIAAVNKDLTTNIAAVNKDLTASIATLGEKLDNKISQQGEKIETIEKKVNVSTGTLAALAVVIPLVAAMFWSAFGPRITELLGIGQHKAPVEQSSSEKPAPH